MKPFTPFQIETLVSNFSHGVFKGYDPISGLGCQRESFADLGFGWIYWALSRIWKAKRILVIGSGQGFSVACFSLGIQDHLDGKVWFVDPGYSTWTVDHQVEDHAAGLWENGDSAVEHFEKNLGLTNIIPLLMRSDEAFTKIKNDNVTFDIIYIDGEHSYSQVLNDFRNAGKSLKPDGLILAHDTCCTQWPGVSLALEHFLSDHPEFTSFTIPHYPGLSILQNKQGFLHLDPVTKDQNDLINSWRQDAGINTRPLSYDHDPRPGQSTEYPHEGLYGIFEEGTLIGGFGLRFKCFKKSGPDDFLPDNGNLLLGYLRYGAVIQPEYRGRGRWKIVTLNLLKTLGPQGFYTITTHDLKDQGRPYRIQKVGQNGGYQAFHIQPNLGADQPLVGLLERELADLTVDLSSKKQENLDLQNSQSLLTEQNTSYRRQLELAEIKYSLVINSRSWRITRPLRRLKTLYANLLGTF
jgi:predicted O-methyltransferase YrrM